jgi:hypothetical protein
LVFSICGQAAANTSSFSQEKVMNNQHTPGPWWLVLPNRRKKATRFNHNQTALVMAGPCHFSIADVGGPSNIEEIETWRANARLISAAPDLLQAAKCALADLEGVMPEFEPSGDRAHPGWQTIEDLRAAIEKAESRS